MWPGRKELNTPPQPLRSALSLSISRTSRDESRETGWFCAASWPNNHSSTAAAAAAAAAMAAFRRMAALAGKLNLWSAAGTEFLGGRAAIGGRGRRSMAVGVCAATGGAVAYYFYSETASVGGRKRIERRSISGLLRSIPTVEANEKVGGCPELVTRSDSRAPWQEMCGSLCWHRGLSVEGCSEIGITLREKTDKVEKWSVYLSSIRPTWPVSLPTSGLELWRGCQPVYFRLGRIVCGCVIHSQHAHWKHFAHCLAAGRCARADA